VLCLRWSVWPVLQSHRKPDSSRCGSSESSARGDSGPALSVFARRPGTLQRLESPRHRDQHQPDLSRCHVPGFIEDENHIHRGLLWIEVPFVEAPTGFWTGFAADARFTSCAKRRRRPRRTSCTAFFPSPGTTRKGTSRPWPASTFTYRGAQGELFFSQATNALAELSLGSGKVSHRPCRRICVGATAQRGNRAALLVRSIVRRRTPSARKVRFGKVQGCGGTYAYPFGLYFLPQLQVYTNYAHLPTEVDSLVHNTEVFFRPEGRIRP